MWKIVEIYDLCGNLEIDSISLCKRFVCQYMKIIRGNLLWLPLLFFIATQAPLFSLEIHSHRTFHTLCLIHFPLLLSLSLSRTRCLPCGHALVSLDTWILHTNIYISVCTCISIYVVGNSNSNSMHYAYWASVQRGFWCVKIVSSCAPAALTILINWKWMPPLTEFECIHSQFASIYRFWVYAMCMYILLENAEQLFVILLSALFVSPDLYFIIGSALSLHVFLSCVL